MTKTTVLSLTACLSSILSLAGCSGKGASTPPCNQGDPGCSVTAGNTSTGGSATTSTSTSSGGTSSVGGVTSAGGTTANATSAGGSSTTNGGTTAKTSTGATGGSSSAAGGKTSAGGTSATGGSSSAAGGKTSTGGTSATGGSSSAAGGKTSTGGTSAGSTGGTRATGGTSAAAGGTAATGGSMAATGGSAAPTTDPGGKALAKPGDKTSGTHDYLNLGNMRLINNNWGSVELQNSGQSCNAPMSVGVNSDGSLGWTFNRGDCNDDGSHPDYPELEFGVAPFGTSNSLRTSPAYSSTTLLPIQVKDIQSASVSIGSFSIQLSGNQNWNLNIEFWLSRLDPLTNGDAQAYLEIMGMWGWSAGADLWKCNVTGQNVTSSGKTYSLCHQVDDWGSGSKWRFFQFKASSNQQSFSGSVDIKAFLDWFYSSSYGSGVSKDYYLTRIELGSEIDDNTSGSCTLKDVSFTINGVTQGPIFGK